MNRIVCAIFFIVGCFGQQNIVSTPPNLNSDTAVPQPQNGILNPPVIGNGAPGLPQPPIPSLPSAPNGIPGLPQPPMPNLPSASNGVPGLPQPPMPNLPSAPNGVPGLPQPPNGIPNTLQSLSGVPVTSAPEIFERPCRPSDLACIRRYFLQHSKCQPAPGRVPDPLFRAIANQYYSRINVTETNLNCEYSGFNNGRIQEFYINRDTDKLVIGIELRDVLKSCNDTFFRYHRRGKEPIITHGFASVLFRSMYLTVIIPQVDDLRLDKSDSFAFSNDLPAVSIDPSLGQSSDPTVPEGFAAFLENFPIDVTENLLTESYFRSITYIQYVICDFGLHII